MTIHGLIFFLLAGALGIFSFAYFTAQRDVTKKRPVWVMVHLAGAAIAIGYAWGFGWPWWARGLLVVAVLFSAQMSLFYSRFCPSCRDLIYGPELPEWEGQCPNCGGALEPDQARETSAKTAGQPEA